jgi:predicted DNA-binding transcriptional regulator YafY
MSLLKYTQRLKRMDELIRRRATGTPDEFASLLGISKSMLMVNLAELKEMGAPVSYDTMRRHYFYERECSFSLGFQLSKTESQVIKGGRNFGHYNDTGMAICLFTMQSIES